MLDFQDVRAAYNLILGRPPESDYVVNCYVASATFDSLRDALLTSPEFLARLEADPSIQAALSPAMRVMQKTQQAPVARRKHPARVGLPIGAVRPLLSRLRQATRLRHPA